MIPEFVKCLGAHFVNVNYDENRIILNRDGDKSHPQNIGQIFKAFGQLYLSNSVAIDGNMRLGWNAVAKFSKRGAGFVLDNIVQLTYDAKVCPGNAVIYNQIVTCAVDTCTFVMLECGNDIVVAHLDGNKSLEGLKIIKECIPLDRKGVNGICSYVLKTSSVKVKTQLVEELGKYGPGLKICRRDDLPEEQNFLYYGHLEMGIYVKDDFKTELFGDLTFDPWSEKVSAQYKRFKETKKFLEYAEEQRPGGGNHCLIV